ncbi:MAG: type I pullulanase, partial [Bacilli bacterium]|nr:type I pullulanase [Bacilli bacterium]
DDPHISLLIDHKIVLKLEGQKGRNYVDFHLTKPLLLGHSYFLLVPSYGRVPLDVKDATTFKGFDETYYFDGELGAIYKKTETTFRLWAPLASKVVLKLKKKDEYYFSEIKMRRGEKGVYEITVKGDLNEAQYLYEVTNNEIALETIDPYAKGSIANARASVVLDLESLKIKKERKNLPEIKNYTDAIIYEGHVRDMTSDLHSTIVNKGEFLGLIEENRKTEKGHRAGFDYFTSLGFTHLQLLPINDFATIDEEEPEDSYNWGYDPSQYFVPEGSYSSNPNDPKARVVEAQMMIEAFHKKGIRINLDVVYNHVYDYLNSSFEKIVPGYYFRKHKNGKMQNASYCGNDFASEKKMVHKLILDSAKWWIDYYDVDGFRFDLMGIIDVETVKEIAKYGKSKDPSFMVYGEGWNMGCETEHKLANMGNANLLPEFAFFNDSYRESAKNYLSGDLNAKESFLFGLFGSSQEWSGRQPMFKRPTSTINYVECHDNRTFFDYLEQKGIKSQKDKEARCKLALASIAFSFGIPFFHMGQELHQSKFGNENSYNAGDTVNKFSYALLDLKSMEANFFRDLLAFRRSVAMLKAPDFSKVAPKVDVKDFEGGAILLVLHDEESFPGFKEISIFLNPSDAPINYCFEKEVTLLFTPGGNALPTNSKLNNVLIPKESFLVVAN